MILYRELNFSLFTLFSLMFKNHFRFRLFCTLNLVSPISRRKFFKERSLA